MKILLVNKFHYIKGGSERYYFGLAKLLQSHGHEVIFFAMEDEKNIPCKQASDFVRNIDYNAQHSLPEMITLGIRVIYSREAKEKINRLIARERPDLVHINLFQSQLTGSIIDAAKQFSLPIVYTVHDLKCVCPNYTMLEHGHPCEKCLHGNFLWCIRNNCMKDSRAKSTLAALESAFYRWRRFYEKIDLFLTPSLFFKNKLEEAKITRSPILHMANFLPDSIPCESDGTFKPYFLYFGRLSAEKGLLFLIDCYAMEPRSMPLYIVGTGPLKQRLQEQIRKKGLESQVILLGFREGKDLYSLVRHAKCVILPSQWYENGPYSVMEAMAFGRPVIVSRMGGLPEIVVPGETGFVYEADNPQQLIHDMRVIEAMDTDCFANMSHRIVETAKQRFSGEAYLSRLLTLYESLLSSSKGKPAVGSVQADKKIEKNEKMKKSEKMNAFSC